MALQSLLGTIKRWRRYVPREELNTVRHHTRGFYVLYKKGRGTRYEVRYIGIAGTGRKGAGIHGRLKSHNRHKDGWTHFSFFEVHDNISGEQIREIEALLLQIFRHDPRIQLSNVQTGSRRFHRARMAAQWSEK
jgi:hypothetical protein